MNLLQNHINNFNEIRIMLPNRNPKTNPFLSFFFYNTIFVDFFKVISCKSKTLINNLIYHLFPNNSSLTMVLQKQSITAVL